ncbi:hypothetical protein ACXR0O_06545 [Verrucomicrobiota bacterium sgz303538]
MITKYWRISLLKNGKPVTLFTTTTDTMVDTDLGGDVTRSLIHVARQYHRHPQTDEQNHRDLAIGAIMAHATEPLYDRNNARIRATDCVPNAEPIAYIGGSRTTLLVPIWEESDDFE